MPRDQAVDDVLEALRVAWPAINHHRGRLICAEIAGTLGTADRDHLRDLQAFASAYVNFVAPRPTADDLPASVKALLD